jgi:23S rRNA pseudouridine1911/1915/1917 synthase
VSPEHRLVVSPEVAGQRLDRSIVALHGQWTRSRVRRLIDGGHVRLNGRPARAAAIVETGDEIVVETPPIEPLAVEAQEIPLDVVFEDGDLLVINKAAGIVIHPAAGNPDGTLVNALLHHCRDLSGIGGVERPGIVHRLDKDTTGLLVVAKSDRAHHGLSLAFRWRTVDKTYLAVCYGVPAPAEGTIDAAIDRHPRDRHKMAVAAGGRAARTRYRVLEDLHGVALVECRPVSGRTHQIRVHLAHVGHAIVGDPLYAGRQWRNLADAAASRACRTFPRQALHAASLQFDHPVSGRRIELEAPLPADLQALLDSLRRR